MHFWARVNREMTANKEIKCPSACFFFVHLLSKLWCGQPFMVEGWSSPWSSTQHTFAPTPLCILQTKKHLFIDVFIYLFVLVLKRNAQCYSHIASGNNNILLYPQALQKGGLTTIIHITADNVIQIQDDACILCQLSSVISRAYLYDWNFQEGTFENIVVDIEDACIQHI